MKKTYQVQLVQYYYAVGAVEVEAESEEEAVELASLYDEADVDWSRLCPEEGPTVIDVKEDAYAGVSA